jgi:hypothetical protein
LIAKQDDPVADHALVNSQGHRKLLAK